DDDDDDREGDEEEGYHPDQGRGEALADAAGPRRRSGLRHSTRTARFRRASGIVTPRARLVVVFTRSTGSRSVSTGMSWSRCPPTCRWMIPASACPSSRYWGTTPMRA